MERQSKEESLAKWALEKDSLEGIEISKGLAKLMQVLDRQIQEYTITYNEYIDDVLEAIGKFEYTDDLKERIAQIETMYEDLINKYNNYEEPTEPTSDTDVRDVSEQ